MEDGIEQLRSWICSQIENTEDMYGAPEEIAHIDVGDFVEVLEYVRRHIDEANDYSFDSEGTDTLD